MFTKQGKQLLIKRALFQTNDTQIEYTSTTGSTFNAKSTQQGLTPTALSTSIYIPPSSTSLGFQGLLVHYGIGTDEPTEDDTNFYENNITRVYDGKMSYTGVVNSDIKNARYIWTHTITNNSTADVFSITEAALIGKFSNGTSSSSYTACVLIARDLLLEPLIINPGDTKSIVYTLDFSTLDNTIKIV